MQNSTYPFNQKEHIFDFKVKVNFQNGNISLTAPQMPTPPANFAHHHPSYPSTPNIYTASIPYNHHYDNSPIQHHPMMNNFVPQLPPRTNQPIFSQSPVNPYIQSPAYNNLPSSSYNNANIPSTYQQLPSHSTQAQLTPQKHQPIQLVNSSYTSMRQASDYSQMINNSMQIIECVLCQKSFNVTEFDQHLELHKNKNNRTQLSNQKNSVSNYALTQNSFNANNDSIVSAQKNKHSLHNQSFHSSSSKNNSLQNDSSFIPNFVNLNGAQNHNTKSLYYDQKKFMNESSHLLGRIDNPILAINAQQQANISLSSSSQHQSLSYSNSHNQSTQRYKNPSQMQSMQQSPNFNQVNNSNGSSFGHHGGNNLIGPSFYHNSSQESANNPKNGVFVKGINRLAYNDANNSIGSHHSSLHGQINPNAMVPNVYLPNNQSYHSNQQHPSYVSNGSHDSHNSYHSHHSQPYINAQVMNNSQQHYQAQNSSNSIRNGHNSSLQEPSYHSNHLQNHINPSQNMMMQNFQTIESRYLNQQTGNSRQLYASQQDINQIRNSRNGSRQYQDGLFNQNDISSISGSSRRDMSEYSDWSDLNAKQYQKHQGYNSADNSIIKQMQSRKQQQQKNQQPNNIYMDRSQNKQKTQEGFMKKKKDHMIASSTSYYDKKFKDEDYSSSDDEFTKKTGQLSYAQRLKEKRVTDNSRPLELSNTKSGRMSKNLKQSSKSINSQDSSLSKTKLPLNYLARQEFISTSSTSKSTHKTNVPN